jgi:signal transduction histidine kinase
MQGMWGPRLRPERLIGAARVVLAVFSLFAVWIDPTEPAKYAELAYTLMLAYVGYAATAAAVVWRSEAVARWWPIVTHAIDLIFFSLFIFVTAGPGSPFNVYFVFSLMCATLRWQLTGTIWTAVVALLAFLGIGAYFGLIVGDPNFNLRAFVIRGDYLLVLAVLLAYIGMHEQRLLRDMWLLASWPHASETNVEPVIRPLLAHASTLLVAPALALVWQGPGDHESHVAFLALNDWRYDREAVEPTLVHRELVERSFLWTDTHAHELLVQNGPQPWRLEPWKGVALDPQWVRRFNATRMLSVAVNGEMATGRLFVIDKTEMSTDDVLVAGIVSSVIAGRLDAYYLDRQLQVAAATEERMRLARDLHDGILQSMTGIGLRLAAVRGRMPPGTQEVSADVDELQRIITDEQKEVRFLIQELRPSPSGAALSLSERLTELVTRFEREWDLEVHLAVELPITLSRRLRQDLYHIVREGLANAARHGSASSATVRLSALDDGRIEVNIADDGRGFSFVGSYTGDQLASMGVGPKSLRERVQALNGSLMLESGPAGAALHICLPAVA